MTKKIKFHLLASCFFIVSQLLGSGSLQAQGTFFQLSSLTQSNLNQSQLTRYQKSLVTDETQVIWFIQLNNFAQQVADQVLELQVPGNTQTYSYHARYVWSPNPSDITWYGDLMNAGGYASFIYKDGELSGNFTIEENDYFIRPLGGNAYILVNQIEDEAPTCGFNLMETPIEEIEEVAPQQASERGENCDVKILVLYTSKAEARIDNVYTFVKALIAQSNQVLRNSGISSSELTIVLAGKALLTGFTETGSISADCTTLRTNSTAISLRNSFAADCVILLTDGNYSDGGGTIYGFAPSCGPSNPASFAIVEADAAASRMTFTHELGHLFGCKHSPGQNNGGCEPTFERPHWFHHNGHDRYTIMENNVKKQYRIPHFSNPDVQYHTHPTGTHANSNGAVERDNARQMREQACIVGSFRSSNDLKANIYGDDHCCVSSLGIPIPLVAQVSGGGPGAYTYLWQISPDGINYNQTLSTTDQAVVPMPVTLQAGDIVFIKFTVVSGTGQMYVTYQEIRVLPLESPDCDGGNGERPAIRANLNENNTAFSVSPNPADNYVRIIPKAQILETFTVELVSVLGNTQERHIFTLQAEGGSGIDINTSQLPNGTYLVRINSKNSFESRKLVIVH